LCVERTRREQDRVYHTVTGGLPLNNCTEKEAEVAKQAVEELVRNNIPPVNVAEEIEVQSRGGKRFLVEKCSEERNGLKESRPMFQLGEYKARPRPKIGGPGKEGTQGDGKKDESPPPGGEEGKRTRGPRALRRRPGRRLTRQQKLARRSSINGHWYDRETCVFTPPKHSAMSVYTSSLATHTDVLAALLSKYKIEAEPGGYALYLVNETGERRVLTELEFPLLLRVKAGPHEDVAKIYLMDKQRTEEIPHQVAAFLR